MISIRNLSKRFPNETAICYADMDFEDGKSYMLLGASGCGKSTLLNMIATIREVDPDAFATLVQVIQDAKALSEKAYGELKNGSYAMVDEYGTTFGDGRKQYKLDKAQELEAGMKQVYQRFSQWLSEWEL